MATSDLIEQLRPYASCDIADALQKLHYPLCGFLPDIVLHSPAFQSGDTKIIGEVSTVKFVHKHDTTSPRLEKHWVDSARPGTILFLSQPPDLYNACFGGIMATRTQKLGVEGVVIDGRIRDIGYIRGSGLPAFARGVSIVGAGADCRASEIDVPVRVNGIPQAIWVTPGDIILGDVDGVVLLPRNLAADVLKLVPKLVAADEKVLEDVSKGMPVEEAFGLHRGKV